MPHSEQPSSPAQRERRRRTHQRIDSNGDLPAPRSRRRRDEDDGSRRRLRDEYEYEDAQTSPSKSRPKRAHHDRERRSSRAPESEYTSSRSSGAALSMAQLEQLNAQNERSEQSDGHRARTERRSSRAPERRREYDEDLERERDREERELERERRRAERHERKRQQRREERRAAEAALAADDDDGHTEYAPKQSRYRRREGRVASGQALERGEEYYSEKETMRGDMRMRGGAASSEATDYDEDARRKKKRRNWYIAAGVIALILVIVIPVGVVVGNKGGGDDDSSSSGDNQGSTAPKNSNLASISQSDIPEDARGGLLDPFDWYDTTDFNVTYTAETVGGLSVMGLNDTWDDTTRANENTPPLNKPWDYGKMKYRGVNIGGWLNLEPFIAPSFFTQFTSADGVVDEYTLSQKLGPLQARTQIEKHYSSWVNEQTFQDIQAAGFDHVRLPFGYWAVTTYEGDPYVPQVAWRYLLRAIEWARKYGLRVNLDLHGAPGSQNGWNHSGRQGEIGWLNGTDGDLNGQRTIDIHDQLSKFFTQERYKNIISMIGLVNEPKNTALVEADVIAWSKKCIDAIRSNGFKGLIIIGDGFMGLDNWQGVLTGVDNVVLDAHQYVIFNVQQIVLNHYDKISFACEGWTEQSKRSMNTATGFGPTMFGEWSQADTDCAQYLNNVGVGSRWEGTLNMVNTPGGESSGNVLEPTCPTANNPRCSCQEANADPSQYSDEYKLWLKTFAQAQMDSFEVGWGWFYWTWKTETATQWSYKDALAAGIMPELAYDRDWSCSDAIPQFNESGLPEYY